MATHPLDPDDYDSAADSDFDASPSPSSGSDSELEITKERKRKAEAEIDSGDEKILEEGVKKKRKKKGKKGKEIDGGIDGDDGVEGGVGLRVRTRSGRGGDEKKKALGNTEAATVDVDELWARLNSTTKSSSDSKPPDGPVGAVQAPNGAGKLADDSSTTPDRNTNPNLKPVDPNTNTYSEPMIAIRRAYVFAGQTTTEEKLVPASSAEARLYLQSQETSQEAQQQSSTTPGGKPALRRPKKRVSLFDPNPNGVPGAAVANTKGPKLNTIEKSKLDWAGYVDKEGMKEELDKAEKGKEGYLGKMDFLGRVEAKREDAIKKK